MSDLTVRSPFQELTNRLNHLFDEAWVRSTLPAQWEEGTLAVDVFETDDEVTVCASLPGFDEDDIEVHVDAGVLSIKAHREETHEEKDERYYRRERFVGAVSRRVALPGVVSDADIRAELDKGVLTVHIPRAQAAKPKKIEVKQAGQ